MRIERITAPTMADALEKVRVVFGEDALVLRTRTLADCVEVVSTTAEELNRFRSGLKSHITPRTPGRRSRVIALIGPTGSGKTTTAAKLALAERAFGWGRVGIISLDTYKVGAYDQVQTYADVAGLSLEVIESPDEAAGALSRLDRCDVIVVDTPGRAPNTNLTEQAWRETLLALAPDETHLVLAAGVRHHVADAVMAHYSDLMPTHLLLTKLDEVPGEAGVAQIADRIGLPARWITDGQSVPDDLYSAPERIMDSALRGDAGDWLMQVAG